jgi:hypothetical protein
VANRSTGGKKRFTLLRDKATGNNALDADAYGPMPHLFFNLAVEYKVPSDFLLTLLFLWDRTVGTGDDCGDCALSQIPVRPRDKSRWLAALVAAGFWDCKKAKSGGKNQRGSFHIYKNPPVEAWESLFQAAGIAQHLANRDAVSPERFGKVFARACGKVVDPPRADDVEPRPEERAAVIKWLRASLAQKS